MDHLRMRLPAESDKGHGEVTPSIIPGTVETPEEFGNKGIPVVMEPKLSKWSEPESGAVGPILEPVDVIPAGTSNVPTVPQAEVWRSG